MTFEAGSVVLNGKYRIVALVGRGAFGEVYRVIHLRLGLERAAKVLTREMPGVGSEAYRSCRERFGLEARLGAILDHANVVKVHDYEEEGGNLFLVMEYAAGGSLKDRLERDGPLPVDDVVCMALELCDGLAAIYEQAQVVHRDIKPSNILFDVEGRTKIADLGLAQVPGGGSLRSLEGLGGAHPGTPEYMSPEQGRERDYLLPTSDVFSLGCVLFEALVGKVYKSVYGTRVRDYRSDVPLWFDEVVARALSETPGRAPGDDEDTSKRYRTAGLMRGDIEPKWQHELALRAKAERERQRKEKRRVAIRAFWSGVLRSFWTYVALAAVLLAGAVVWNPADWRGSAARLGPLCLGRVSDLTAQVAGIPRQAATSPGPVSAPDAVVWAPVAEMRSGPGAGHDLIAEYPEDTGFVVLAQDASGEWLKVSAPDGKEGWVDLWRYLELKVPLSSIPGVPAPTKTAPALFSGATVVADEAILYSEPGGQDGAVVLSRYALGAEVTVFGQDPDGEWLKVQGPDGQVGWMELWSSLRSEVPLTQIPVLATSPAIAPTLRATPLTATTTPTATSAPELLLYEVQPGDSLFSIADRFGVTLDSLVAANSSMTDPNQLAAGLQLVIPVAGDSSNSVVASIGEYTIQPGDTLAGIAERFGLTLEELLQANPPASGENQMLAGQVLIIPAIDGHAMPTVHVVRAGETLSGIAARYGVAVWSIVLRNNLATTGELPEGQLLVIP